MAFGLMFLVVLTAVFPLASGVTDFKALVEQLDKLNVKMNAMRREMMETKAACDRQHGKSMLGELSRIYHVSNLNWTKVDF